jgi:CRISPR-associated protein Csx10
MKKKGIELGLVSPVCITKHRGVDNVIRTQDYIPGSVFRGALAAEYIRNGLQDTDEFKNLFIDKKACFGDLRKAGSKNVPLSALTCKYYPGWKSENRLEPRHGIVDSVIPRLKYDLFSQEMPKHIVECQHQQCKGKNIHMIPYAGYYAEKRLLNYKPVEIDKNIHVHTQVSEKMLTATAGTLYSIEGLTPDQTFSGVVSIDEDVDLANLEKILTDRTMLLLGCDKTRGMGKARVFKAIHSDGMDIDNAVYQFNAKLSGDEMAINTWFTLTISSRTILLDRYLFYKPIIDIEDLIDSVPEGIEFWQACTLQRAWNQTEPVEGWNSLTGFPKAQEWAISAGSVFVFQCDRPINENDLSFLHKLVDNGVGCRKEEGFGNISVCDPFHWLGGEL